MTPSEKSNLYEKWTIIEAEKPGIDTQLSNFSLDSSSEANIHNLAYTALADYLNPLFIAMDITDDVDGNVLLQKFIDYSVAKQTVLYKIDNEEKRRVDELKEKQDEMDSEQAVIKNFMRIGDVKLGDGTIVYGIAIGKDVSVLNPDGTIKNTNAASIATATDYSFLVNGSKVGEFSNSGLKTDKVNTPVIEMNSQWVWRSGLDGHLTLRPL